MYTYSWPLTTEEYGPMKRQLFLINQYDALLEFLEREEKIFGDPKMVSDWKMKLTAELSLCQNRLSMEQNRFMRTYLVPYFPPEYSWTFRYDFGVDTICVECDHELKIPDMYTNRPPRLHVLEYSAIVSELFPELTEGLECSHGDINGTSVRSITFQVTDGCNLRCSYCYQINKHNNFMDEKTADEMIEIILGTKKENPWINERNSTALVIDFIGGEPFLAVDLMEHICTQFVKRLFETNSKYLPFFRFSTCSNGVLYRDPRVQNFLKKWNKLLSFSVTVDGNKELHDSCRVFPDGSGSYDYAIDAVTTHMKAGYSMGSKVTIAPANVTYLYDAIMHMVDFGYTDIHANCVFEEGWTIDHAKEYYKQMKKLADEFIEKRLDKKVIFALFKYDWYRPMEPEKNNNWCGGTGSMLAVDYKGDIFPCLRYMESSIGPDMKPIIIGNVDRGLVTTDEEHEIMDSLRSITRRSQSTDECFNCPIAEGCAWCSANNYQCFGTVNKRATFICPMHKAEALANNYYWNKLFIKEPQGHIVMDIHIPEEWALEIIDNDEWQMIKNLYKEAKSLC